MMNFWKNTKKITIGRIDSTDIANICPYCETLSWAMKMRSASGTV
jgi:hypothetical protein